MTEYPSSDSPDMITRELALLPHPFFATAYYHLAMSVIGIVEELNVRYDKETLVAAVQTMFGEDVAELDPTDLYDEHTFLATAVAKVMGWSRNDASKVSGALDTVVQEIQDTKQAYLTAEYEESFKMFAEKTKEYAKTATQVATVSTFPEDDERLDEVSRGFMTEYMTALRDAVDILP